MNALADNQTLLDLLPADRIIPGKDARLFATDVYRSMAFPEYVVRPKNLDELRATVIRAANTGYAIVVRGGGVSYTDGYLPARAQTVLIDTGALTRIIDLNLKDMNVTVEPGITWQALDAALQPHGVKVPFLGTFSGLAASVGGTISQNANGLSSNAHGISADSVIGIEIMTPKGGIVQTGRVCGTPQSSYFRYYGPDLTGLFTGDCGALGVKTAITLKLVRRKPFFQAASFAFPNFQALHNAMSAIAAEKIEDKSFGLDLALSQGQIGRQDAGSLVNMVRHVWQSSPNTITGLRSIASMAAAGTRVLAAAPYAAHYIVDGHEAVEAKAKLIPIRRIAHQFGREIANSVPAIVRSMPFQPLHNMLGPAGERWVPLHGLLPHSQVSAFHRALSAYINSQADEMQKNAVHIGAMFSCIGSTTFLYEPALYWKDQRSIFHEMMMEPAYLAKLPVYPSNPLGAELVEKIRSDIIAIMQSHGAAHLQIGKLYPYLEGCQAGAVSLLKAIKRDLDPDNLMNPGALGF